MMRRHDLLARRDLLKSAAALSAGMALQRAHLAGAQDASPTVEPQEVTVTNPVEGKLNVTWWSPNNPAFVAANVEMINRFQAANPDINIVYQYFPYDVLISKLQAGYNSGTVADMQQMFGTWVTQYARYGLLDPVPANLSEGMADRFFDAAIGAYGLNGQYYGMPKEYNLENGAMLVNPALLEEAGVTDSPSTWQELMDNAVKATKYDDQNRITQAGFLMASNDAITFIFLAMILQQGANYWADDGVHVNFQTDAAKKAWQDETDIVTKYHVEDETSLPNEDRYVVFFQGKGAMCQSDPGRLRSVRKTTRIWISITSTYRPYAGTEYRFAAESGWGEVVNANAAGREQGSRLEVHRLHGPARQSARLEYGHLYHPVPEGPAERSGHSRGGSAVAGSFNVLPYGQWIGPVQDRDRFWRSIHDAFTAVGLGQMDAPSALVQAEQQINQMIDEVAGP